MVPGAVQASRASLKLEDFDVDGLLRVSGTVPRETLLDMSKGSLKRYLTLVSHEDSAHAHNVQGLWRGLLATMRDASVVDRHMTAACNAICVFLHCASSSLVPLVRLFAMSEEVWTDVFDALLINFLSGKQKPLRQVLNTLIKILADHDDRTIARSIENRVLSRMAAIILLGSPLAYFKASIVIFDAFVRSSIPLSLTLSAVARCHGLNRLPWENRLRLLGFDGNIACETTNNQTVDESICHFSFSIILAVAESDAPATSGTLFSRFISMLAEYHILPGTIWIEHVVSILHCYPRAIEAFKNYLLAPVLKLHPNHYDQLLYRMTRNDHDSSMLHNSLAIIILGRDAGLLPEEGKWFCSSHQNVELLL